LELRHFNISFTQYEEYGEEFVDMLDGMFSFVLLDTRDKSFMAARDAIGICPLYMGWGLDGMKANQLIVLSF
jgi:asparagine synthetase B (glutamine-hydrolysing)